MECTSLDTHYLIAWSRCREYKKKPVIEVEVEVEVEVGLSRKKGVELQSVSEP
jgi:hypothetical protein